MIKLFQSSTNAAVVGALLYCITTVLCWHPVASTASAPRPASELRSGPSWTFKNPELDQLVAELKREKSSLTEKEKQLNELALRLQSERQELNQVTQTVHELQLEFDHNVVRVQEQEAPNIRRLAKVYATMAPENAVPILKQMDETTLVKILAVMKDSETAPILEVMGKQGEAEAKRAAALSERLRLALPKAVPGPTTNR